jgi:hypothetical protein
MTPRVRPRRYFFTGALEGFIGALAGFSPFF